jgi:PAS domain S-box-containing protein
MAAELARLAKVAELTSNEVFIQDADRQTIWANRAFLETTGLTEETALGRRVRDIVDFGSTDPATLAGLADAVAGERGFKGEFRCRLQSGEVRWFNLDSHAMHDADGAVQGYVNVLTDLTDIRRLNRQLEENLALIDALFDTIPVPVVLKDVDGRYIRLNRAYADLFATDPADVLGKDASTVIDTGAAAIHLAVDHELLAGPGKKTYEVHQRLSGGREFDALVSKASLVGPDGAVTGLVGTVVDISAEKAAQAALRAARDAAQAASMAKTRFLANMSHELRTPLNAVIGAAQLLRSGGQDGSSQEDLVQAIEQSGTTLLGLIENILDLSRIEAGELALVVEDFNLLDCSEAAVATAAVNARAKGLSLACVIDPALPLWRRGDAARLRQVLLNLLGNAVKFTERGDVVLRVMPGEGAGGLRITVSDTGIGIGEASLERVFEPFRQADDAATRRFGGSGLGLAIVRQLVEAMGGRISVSSRLDEGTVFTVDLELPPALGSYVEPPPLGQAIAYYEPHPASAEALHDLLERMGCSAHRCHTAVDLREWLARQEQAGTRPWLLAAADAASTWDMVEQSIAWLEPERVIGMTDAASPEADAARERFGLPRHVMKPVLRSALVSRLGAVPGPVGTAPAGTARAAPSGPVDRKHVLVVEDDALNQTIVCGMLHHAGYATLTASDGASALEAVRRGGFDVVLMDWQMPDMDGLEVTRRMRAGEAGAYGRHVPVIALTANAFAEDRAACLAAGMNDFLTKPVLAAHLVGTVRRWAGDNMVAELLPAEPSSSDFAAYDATVLAELPMVADGSQPEYADHVLRVYCDNTRKVLDAIEAALRDGEAKVLMRNIHSLKSSSGSVGALALAEEARRQEALLRAGACPQAESAALLRAQYGRFIEALEQHRGRVAETEGEMT